MDIHQLWEITSAPDNVPILILMVLVPIYTWMAARRAFANDKLIKELEADPEMAKTHHRKTFPYKKEWPKTVHVWPYLLKIEFLVAIIVTVILIVWSIVLEAPLEAPANPNLTMNPAKAPWYFLGLQEMLVYFDPWIAGVILPGLVLGGLMAIPYCDTSPLGCGYYTWSQRKYAVGFFLTGFGLWLVLSIVGVFVRGPGWMLFWPGQTWDSHRQVNESYWHLYQLAGIAEDNYWGIFLFGATAVGTFFAGTFGILHVIYTRLKPETYKQMNIFQYMTMQFFMICFLALPIKMALWHLLHLKYVWIVPWFNINF